MKNDTVSPVKELALAVVASEVDLPLHVADSAAKSIQNAAFPISGWGSFKAAIAMQNGHHYPDFCPKDITNKEVLHTLFQGIGYSGLNKALTRTYRFSLQAKLQSILNEKTAPLLPSNFDVKTAQAFIGGVSGLMTSLTETAIFHPLDTIKTRKQLGTNGRVGLYAGLTPALIKGAATGAVFFSSFNFFSNLMKKRKQSFLAENMVASTAAGIVNTVVTNPIDVVKTRLQADHSSVPDKPNQMNMMKVAKKIFSEEGAKAFSKGVLVKSLQSPLKSALPFCVFNCIKRYIEKPSDILPNEKKSIKI